MKKIFVFVLVLIMYMAAITTYASPGYEPGIAGDATTKKGEFKYRETVFVSGEPIIMDGTIKVNQDSKGVKTTLEYKLSNLEKDASLTRKVTYLNSSESNVMGNQTSASTSLDPNYKETIEIGGDEYSLVEYHFSGSGVTDDKAIIKYLRGNWIGKKVYSKNDDTAQIVIDTSTDTYSYDNFWSSTETILLRSSLTYRYKETPNSNTYKEAVGSIDYAVSNSRIKNLEYMVNSLESISFRGACILKEGQENVVSYTYNLPELNNGTPSGKRNSGQNSYKLLTVPTQTSLIVPVIKDISPSYWAYAEINNVTSMDIISMADSSYFRPLSFISRGEFAKAIVKASDIVVENNNQKKLKPYEAVFVDVEETHPYSSYINAAARTGVMNGVSSSRFGPDEYLTKAQAAAIIVRAMGLEDASDVSSTVTSFSDDGDVPLWAKKSINVAHRMGIVSGNTDGEIEPNKILTRAESAVMINRFINYLQYDIRKEYREKMINFAR